MNTLSQRYNDIQEAGLLSGMLREKLGARQGSLRGYLVSPGPAVQVNKT